MQEDVAQGRAVVEFVQVHMAGYSGHSPFLGELPDIVLPRTVEIGRGLAVAGDEDEVFVELGCQHLVVETVLAVEQGILAVFLLHQLHELVETLLKVAATEAPHARLLHIDHGQEVLLAFLHMASEMLKLFLGIL